MVLKQGPRLPIVGKGCMQYTWEIRRTLWHQWRAASQQHIVQESTANKHVNGMNDEPSCRKKTYSTTTNIGTCIFISFISNLPRFFWRGSFFHHLAQEVIDSNLTPTVNLYTPLVPSCWRCRWKCDFWGSGVIVASRCHVPAMSDVMAKGRYPIPLRKCSAP